MRNAVVLCAGLLTLMLPSMAMAQAQAPAQGQGQSNAWMPAGGRIFVAINGLYQPGEETIEQTASYSVYDETATASAIQTVKNGGGMFDFGGGYRTNRYGIGISYTQFKSNNSASISASIPHPIFFDRPRTASTTLDGLEHTEHVVHVAGLLLRARRQEDGRRRVHRPVVFQRHAGLRHRPQRFTESSNFATVSLPVGAAPVKDSPVGFNIGGELTYTITPNVAGAFLLRFSRANADFEFEGATTSMNVGNVQVGGGVRLRF